MKLIWLLTLLGLGISTAAAAETYSTWRSYSSGKLIAEEDAVAPGEKVTIGFDVHLQKHWHTYWINPGDSGTPLKLSLEARSEQKVFDVLTGPIQFPLPNRLITGPITSFVYDDEVLFLADVVMPDSLRIGTELNLHLNAEWLVCEDVCIPAIDEFDLKLPVKAAGDLHPSPSAEQFVAWRGRLPHLQSSPVERQVSSSSAQLKFEIPPDFKTAKVVDFFPLRGSGLTTAPPVVARQTPSSLEFKMGTKGAPADRSDLVGLLVLKTSEGPLVGLQWGDPSYGFVTKAAAPKESEAMPLVSLLGILISAFLGGLILNLMPCVFPVLSIKLLSVVKQSGGPALAVRKQNLAYVVGVILSFLAIGALLAFLRAGGDLIGWGFQLQSPVFVLLLSWLFFLLALQMFGYFELEWLNPNWGGKLARQDGLSGAFFTGVLAVVVASPCTAPFMGAALGFALAQGTVVLLLIFAMMGLGLAFPYLMFAAFPGIACLLPRPGAWMQSLKELMAFPLLLTCVWLVWLLSELKGNLAVGLALTGMVAWFFIFWWKSSSHIMRLFLSAVIVGMGLYVLHRLPETGPDKLSADAAWVPFSEKALQTAPGEAVFVDFTADWCLTCKLNERLVLTQPDVMQYFESHHIRLVKGDWTKQDPNITRFLNNYRRAGVPFYIGFGPGAPDGHIFPEVLTPALFKSEMDAVLKPKEGP